MCHPMPSWAESSPSARVPLPAAVSKGRLHHKPAEPKVVDQLDANPIPRCDKSHLHVAVKQINGATFDMQPLFLSSLREISKHGATQLLLNYRLSPYASV